MKKLITVLVVLMLISSLFTGCVQQPETPSATQSPATETSQVESSSATTKKIAVITGTGGLGDKNLNDFVYDGVKKHEAEGIKVDVVQPKDSSDFDNLQKLYAESGEYATIVCITLDQVDPLAKNAADFPNQSFILCDAYLDAPNVMNIGFKMEDTGFQLGVVAGMIVKENNLPNARGQNTIGFIGGMDIPLINSFYAGYMAGAKLVNPDVKILGAYVGSFGDPSTAEELATGLYEQGADIIFACAGGSGLGVFTAAEKSKGYALGIETNQNTISPDTIIASGMRDWGKLVYDMTQLALDGTIEGGSINYGIADGVLRVEREGSNVVIGDDVMVKLQELSDRVSDGSLKLPTTLDAVDAFIEQNVE